MCVAKGSVSMPLRLRKVMAIVCFATILVLLASCNQKASDDSVEQEAQIERFLAEQGIKRTPAEPFDFPPVVDTKKLSSTVLVSRLEDSIPAGKNVVYCATSQLVNAVDDLAVVKQGLLASANVVPKGSCRFFTGSLNEIRRQSEARFPSLADSAEWQSGDEPWWCCHFQRSLPFLEAFELLEEPLVFRSSNGEFKVDSFGDRRFDESSVQQSLRKEQITIVDFKSEDDFVVRLNTQVNEDELILAKVQPRLSLAATLEGVMQRVRSNPLEGSVGADIREGEALVVPMLTVSLIEWFSNHPPGFQTIRFRLDEKGAVLDSWLGYLNIGSDVVLRQMVFDKPFLLYLKSKNAKAPYFVLWVDNPEVMQPFAANTEN